MEQVEPRSGVAALLAWKYLLAQAVASGCSQQVLASQSFSPLAEREQLQPQVPARKAVEETQRRSVVEAQWASDSVRQPLVRKTARRRWHLATLLFFPEE